KEDKAKNVLDLHHPCSGTRKCATSQSAERDEWESLTQSQREECGRAQINVTGVGDVKEGGSQRCGDTWADDQRREETHSGRTQQRAPRASLNSSHPSDPGSGEL